ncbi:hypothetical protein MN116_008951 [Schistosoma mekongi]|uniref:Uncharacterized protein n=1 Tax=Schistosoma mekongi TaxID=38744 RepID=A0AAE1Z4A8_SCHME|nr:hypothetical protein MN116_008951 [Schistosoma mekongi]
MYHYFTLTKIQVIQNKTQEMKGRFEFLKTLAKYAKFKNDLSSYVMYLLLDIYIQRKTNSMSSQSICIFDAVFRIALVKELILDEPVIVDNTLLIDFTYIIGSTYNDTTLRCDAHNVIDWFISPLFLLSNDNVSNSRKCCGCSQEFQVPLSVPLFCLSQVRPLPVENTLKLLIEAIKQLTDDIHCSNKSDMGKTLKMEEKERLFQIMAMLQALQHIRTQTNSPLNQLNISQYNKFFKELISMAK